MDSRKDILMDREIFEKELQVSVITAIGKIIAETKGQQLYAIAPCTDEDGGNVAMATSTEEFYGQNLLQGSTDEPNYREDELYYRWAPSE